MTASGPLSGLRVVEMAGIGPVPHAAMVLADLGADVVRVERPGTASSPDGVVDADAALYRNRQRTAVDLRSDAGRTAVLHLVAAADVLLEGFRPGVMERLGLGPEECLAVSPGLVYGRMSGWGQDGPWARTAGHDINYLAVTGVLETMGPAGEPPLPPLNLVGDFGGGSMFLVAGVLAALHDRGRGGGGQVVDAAMVDGVGVLAQLLWSWRAAGRWSDHRGANLLDGSAPFYSTYRCADGRFVAVGALEPQFWELLVTGLALEEADLPDRWDRRRWPELRAVLAGRFAERTRDAWAEHFAGTDACVTPVLSFAEAGAHPAARARGTTVTVDGVEQAAAAPRFSRHPQRPPSSVREVGPADVLARWRTGPGADQDAGAST